MVGCLILYEPAILSLTKSRMLRSMFYQRKFEIHVLANYTVLIFVWNINRTQVWQAALIMESENIAVGYGVAESEMDAGVQAIKKLQERLLMHDY